MSDKRIKRIKMSEVELLETFIKLVEYANDRGADGIKIIINAPDGGKLKCRFEYKAIVLEGYHDN